MKVRSSRGRVAKASCTLLLNESRKSEELPALRTDEHMLLRLLGRTLRYQCAFIVLEQPRLSRCASTRFGRRPKP